MVAFPLLAKMRLSEFVVSLEPATRGFSEVLEMYSVAVRVGKWLEDYGLLGKTHVINIINCTKVESKCVTREWCVGHHECVTGSND